MTPGFKTWFHTVRHLRPVQIYGRIWFRLYRPSIDKYRTTIVRPSSGVWEEPAHRKPSLLHPWLFRFLNEEHQLAVPVDWDNQAVSKLWRYNLHYFDDLNADDSKARVDWHRKLIARWVAEIPLARGSGWEPYPTSLRIVNWIKWALAGYSFEPEWLQNLETQARWLSHRLEWHLLGNHLFANAKALVFAGLYFEGRESDDWLNKGLDILAREMPEQILSDGGQFERSTMYHALALEDVLDLINITKTFPKAIPEKWRSFLYTWPLVAQRMLNWLRAMCHSDGEISFFNDAAIGIAPVPAELERYANSLLGMTSKQSKNAGAAKLPRMQHLSDSGYVRVEVPDAVVLMDVAPIGPDYLPGHAHADTLSFELSMFGHRVIVNGGTSRYGVGNERDAERSTRAHSTVMIDDEDSSVVWAGFRVGQRARPFDLSITNNAHEARISCAHDGYRRLSGKPVHHRVLLLQPRLLRIEDRVEGIFKHAVARFHLHPSIVCIQEKSAASGSLRLPGGQMVHWQVQGGSVCIEPSVYCPEFGLRMPSHCLAVTLGNASDSQMTLAW